MEIKDYTLSELGIFIRESADEERMEFHNRILAAWLGFNADQKNLQSIIGTNIMKSGSAKPQQSSAAVEHEWKRAASALARLR